MGSTLYNNVSSLNETSLILNESNDLHSVAGSVLNLGQPLHPYYTRSAAKLSTRSSNSCASLSNSDTTTRRSVASNSSHLSRTLTQSEQRKGSKESSSTSSFVSVSNQIDTNENLIISNNRHAALVVNQNRSKVNGTLRLVIFLLLGILGLIAVYIHQNIMNSKSFLSKVEDDLCRIKEDIERMKNSFEKGTKTQLQSMEKDTRQKLDTVERLLRDIRKEKKSIEEYPSCASKLFGAKLGNEGAIRTVVMQLLEEYSADKTGKTDFALESAGGSIVSCSSDTQPYNPASGLTTLFGIPLCYKSNGPRSIIQPTVLPGECWAFKGTAGALTIKLLGPVFISGVSLEHISKSISPSGEIYSAPKEFSIWAAINGDSLSLGQFVYDINGPTLQYFDVQSSIKSFRYIEFKVHSNHGNPNYTCVYRLRVHGVLDTTEVAN